MRRALAANIRRRFGRQQLARLYYFAPGVNWSLDWDGRYITSEVEKQFGLQARVVNEVDRLSGQIIHCASLWEMSACAGTNLSKDNIIVGTIFHGEKDAPQFKAAFGKVLANQDKFARVHTASKIMEQRLIDWGLPAKKMVRIPLGVELKQFHPVDEGQRVASRKKLGIPKGAFCIGSFQKDGVGMSEGLEPKLIKGPDVFVQVIEQVSKSRPVFVLLSAPARGYVKAGLERARIPYRHIVLEDYFQIPSLFHALDIYLMTSREEGGPKGPLEAMACGIPVVATQVGLVADVIKAGETGLLADSDDVEGLAIQVIKLIGDPGLRRQIADKGLEAIKDYDWPLIAARYYHEIYKPILDGLEQ